MLLDRNVGMFSSVAVVSASTEQIFAALCSAVCDAGVCLALIGCFHELWKKAVVHVQFLVRKKKSKVGATVNAVISHQAWLGVNKII